MNFLVNTTILTLCDYNLVSDDELGFAVRYNTKVEYGNTTLVKFVLSERATKTATAVLIDGSLIAINIAECVGRNDFGEPIYKTIITKKF